MNKSMDFYLSTNSLDEKRAILGALFNGYADLVAGVVPSALKNIQNATSLLGKNEKLEEVQDMAAGGFVSDAKTELESIIRDVISGMKVRN